MRRRRRWERDDTVRFAVRDRYLGTKNGPSFLEPFL